jgi:hypothetical protein
LWRGWLFFGATCSRSLWSDLTASLRLGHNTPSVDARNAHLVQEDIASSPMWPIRASFRSKLNDIFVLIDILRSSNPVAELAGRLQNSNVARWWCVIEKARTSIVAVVRGWRIQRTI